MKGLLAVVILSLAVVGQLARADAVPVVTADRTGCETQGAAFDAANDVYNKDHATGRTFLRSFYQNGARAKVGMHDADLKTAMGNLAKCQSAVAQERVDAKDRAREAEYSARPEVMARNEAIAKANLRKNGLVDVETFTPAEWLRGVGLTPWVPIGKNESKAFFYTYGSKDFQTYINIKTATQGPGDDYILMEFLSAQIDCRPNQDYPAALPMPMTYSYNAQGRPMLDDYNSPLGYEMPVEHGTILAAAVIGTCDEVRKHNGTVNYNG